MFKFDGRSSSRDLAIDAVPPPDGDILVKYRAFLAWGEHCVECAAPSCYASCDLFKATATGTCRRFEDGIRKRSRTTLRGSPAAEVKFRRWGKLEAQGNARLMPRAQTAMIEHLFGTMWPIANRLGMLVAHATGDKRWSTVMEALHKRVNNLLRTTTAGPMPDIFLAEISNPTVDPTELVLTISVDRKHLSRVIPAEQLPPQRSYLIVATPGFSRHVLPVVEAADILASNLPFTLALVPANDATPHLVFHKLELASSGGASLSALPSTPATSLASTIKCVAFDLDNTLWDGVLLEGPVRLRAGMRELFSTLDQRGILISVVSKNAPVDALSQLKTFALDDYLLHPMISWRPKSESLRLLAKALDIGMDSLLFIDDNPFERAEVRAALPEVEVLPDTEISRLALQPRLQGAVTKESRERRMMYRQAMAREELALGFTGDYQKFLRSCDLQVLIRPDEPADFDRIVELVQRTNQLNFSGRKYSRAEITEILNDPKRERYILNVSDKFGSYGTVGFCLTRRRHDVVHVDDFMLSCRVQGKFIEQALFWYLTEHADVTVRRIQVDFHRTERNGAAHMVMETLLFSASDEGGLARAVSPGDFALDFLTIDARGPSPRCSTTMTE